MKTALLTTLVLAGLLALGCATVVPTKVADSIALLCSNVVVLDDAVRSNPAVTPHDKALADEQDSLAHEIAVWAAAHSEGK